MRTTTGIWLQGLHQTRGGSYRLFVSRTRYTPGSLDSLLRQVADDVAGGVIIADTALRWLYHPYDGGADVILPSSEERDRLKRRYRDWLSIDPGGLRAHSHAAGRSLCAADWAPPVAVAGADA